MIFTQRVHLGDLLTALTAALLIVALSGCATRPRVDWASRIGNYTYDQAVLELGPPDKTATLASGERIADWVLRRGYSRVYFSSVFGAYPYYIGPTHPVYVDSFPEVVLRLTFDREGRLQSWKRITR